MFSVYHWAGCLAEEKWAPFISYVTGWFNFLGNVAADAFFGYTLAAVVSSLFKMSGRPELTTAEQVGIGIFVCFLWSLQNALRIDHQGWINNFASVFQVAFSFAVIITLLVDCDSSKRASLDQVFFTFYNGTGFESVGYVVMIGMLTTLYSFTGYEAAGIILRLIVIDKNIRSHVGRDA